MFGVTITEARRDVSEAGVTRSGIEVTEYCRSTSGGRVDQQLKQLMKELGEAINESLADSEQIAEVVSKIKDSGYDIFLVLEATIGVSKPGEKSDRQDFPGDHPDAPIPSSRSATRTSSS